jgi:hypothetical protein
MIAAGKKELKYTRISGCYFDYCQAIYRKVHPITVAIGTLRCSSTVSDSARCSRIISSSDEVFIV